MDAVYNFSVTSPELLKIYFGLAEGKWKKRYYNHKNSFNSKQYSHEVTLSGYVWYLFFFFNWYSLHARLNSHLEAWSYKKWKHKKVKAYRKSI